MNISYINSGAKIFRSCDKNSTNPQVSFCGSQIMDQINEFKNSKKTNGFHNVKTTDLLRILKYYGYTDKQETGHRHIVDNYGRKYQYQSDTIANPNFAAAVIRGIKLADEFDGALFLFVQEPTPEQLQQCKKLVEEKPPYLDANNKYAQWLKKENDKIEAEKVSAEDEVRKTNEKINAQRLMHVELTQSIDSQERKLNDLKDELKELKEILSNKDNKIFNTKIQKVERTQNITEEQIAQIRKSLNSCASQLQNNKVLNDDDVNNLKKSEAQVKKYIVEIEQDVETLQASAVSVMEEASIFVDKINQAYDSLIVEYVDLKSKIEEHSEILNSVAFLFSGEKTLADCINAVNNAQKQLEKLENTMRQFVILDSDQPLKKYEKQLESIENARTCLRKLSQNYELIGKQIEKDYLPLNQTSESELKQRREERIEKFNKKLAVSSKQPVLETGETTQPEQITEKTSKSAQKNKVDNETELSAKDKKFARMLAGKISPFPIEYVESRLAKIFESNISFIMPQFIFSETSYSADAMVSAICLDLGKNNFTRETVNAIRFAFLENLYEQSENKDGRIYSLNSKQAREVYEKIQKGAKEFDVRTDNGTLHIKLNSEFDMQRLEETYKKYLGNVGNDSDNAQKALNYLLEFAPAQSGIKFYAQEHFSDKGLYYTQLVSEKAPKELKIAIFKDFWEYMDMILRTNHSKDIVEQFVKELEVQEQKVQHQEKIDLFESLDWEF